MAETALIRADSLAFQAASATPVGSAAVEASDTGGRLQSPVPTLGGVFWSTTSTMFTDTTTVGTMASQLVASGIKILNYSDAVARYLGNLMSENPTKHDLSESANRKSFFL
jgi:hypothetical protein